MKTVSSSALRRIAALLLLLVLLLPFTSPFGKTGEVGSEEIAVPALLSGSPDDGLITESEFYRYLLGELLKCKTEINVADYELNEDEVGQVYAMLFYSEAELFYIDGRYSFTRYQGSSVVRTIRPVYPENVDEIPAQLAEFHELADEIIAQVDPSFSEWEKVAFVHDYVALHYDYDHDLEIYDAYGMLKTGIGVCQAYSLLTRYLLRKLGVECECVSSAELNHEWNVVKIDGHWYHMDVTWDDRDDKGFYGQVSHEFFLSSDAHFYNGVSEDRNHRGAWDSPVSTDDFKYDGTFEDVTTPFVFTSDGIYFIRDGSLTTYDPEIEQFRTLFDLNLQWHAFGGVWQGTFAGLWYLNGNLYWNGENAVYSYVPGSGATSATQVDRYIGFTDSIFGMRAEADDRAVTFTLALMHDPNSGTVKEEVRSKGGYTITWQVAGETYQTVCLRNEIPHFDGSLELPSNLFDYTFLQWDRTPTQAKGDATYTAQFKMERNDVELTGKTLREQYRLIRAALLLLDYADAGYAEATDRIAELNGLADAFAESVETYNAVFDGVLFGAD